MNKLKNFLFANNSNDYHPGILKTSSIAGIIALFVIYHIISSIFFPVAKTVASDLTVGNILEAINRERSIRNLLTLNPHDALSRAAQIKSDDMISRNYFSHTDPEGNYIWPTITSQGYTPYLQLGENLAIEFYNTESLVSAWMNSPTHRANIVNEGFKDQGMGLAFGNQNQAQYFSAITNTFGALITSKKTTPPPPAPSPAPIAKNPPQPVAKPAPLPTTPPPVVVVTPPVALPPAPEPTTKQNTASSTDTHKTPLPSSSGPKTSTSTPEGVLSNETPLRATDPYNINRYISLAFGGTLLVLLLLDAWIVLEKRLKLLDKKINNLFVLVLALIIVAIMYLT
jgi:hypothetical protein